MPHRVSTDGSVATCSRHGIRSASAPVTRRGRRPGSQPGMVDIPSPLADTYRDGSGRVTHRLDKAVTRGLWPT